MFIFLAIAILYYLSFILYYFITSCITNIKNCHNKKVWEYRVWPVHAFSCVYLV